MPKIVFQKEKILSFTKDFLKTLESLMKQIFLLLIFLYQKTISPDEGILKFFLKGKVCGHQPHCSDYAKKCFQRYSFFDAFDFSLQRVMSCRGQKKYDPHFYKIVFFSSAQIGVPFLEKLLSDKRFEVVGIVTTPPKPVGRGMKLTPSPVQKFVEEKNLKIPIQTPQKIKNNSEFDLWLKNLNPDFLVVISYGKILPINILELAKFGPINVHGSLLPKYRGASPIQSVFLNNEKETGITIMKMNQNLDEGDIISQLKIEIPFDWTARELINWMQEFGPQFLNDSLRDFGKGRIKAKAQDNSKASYCKKIQKSDGEISPFEESLESIYCKYRAFVFWPKIFFEHGKKHFVIEKLILDKNIFKTAKNQPLFIWQNGKLNLNSAVKEIFIKPQSKKSLSWKEFVNGNFLKN